MKSLKSFVKILLWSLGISIAVRIMFGAESVFGYLILIFPFLAALAASFSLASSSTAGYVVSSSLHLVFTTGFYILADITGFFRKLPYESADFFEKFASDNAVNTDIVWCILSVMSVYFASFIIISSIISSVKMRKRTESEIDTDEELTEESLSE